MLPVRRGGYFYKLSTHIVPLPARLGLFALLTNSAIEQPVGSAEPCVSTKPAPDLYGIVRPLIRADNFDIRAIIAHFLNKLLMRLLLVLCTARTSVPAGQRIGRCAPDVLTFQTLNLYAGRAVDVCAKQTNERILDCKLSGKFLVCFPSHFSPTFRRFLDYITNSRRNKEEIAKNTTLGWCSLRIFKFSHQYLGYFLVLCWCSAYCHQGVWL